MESINISYTGTSKLATSGATLIPIYTKMVIIISSIPLLMLITPHQKAAPISNNAAASTAAATPNRCRI